MPTDHDTYLHKVASAPPKESDPLRDTVPTEVVPPPSNVLQGELVTSTEDTPAEQGMTDEQDAPDEQDARNAFNRREAFDEQDALDEPEAEEAPDSEMGPEAEREAGLEAKAEPAAGTGLEPAPEVREPAPEVREPVSQAHEPVPQAEAEPGQGLLADGAATRQKWMHLQASFVDDPRAAVAEGAALVTDVLAQLEAAVRNQQLTGDTEALRLQMRRYRLLVDRLTGL